MINPNFSLKDVDIQNFKEHGFILLKDFFSQDIINHLKKLADKNGEKPNTNYGSGFNRLKYDLGNHDEKILDLICDESFGKNIHRLTGHQLLYTQGLSFELEKNKSMGFPWHVGTQSFGFQKKEEFACTLWVPFCEINPKKQRGGMAYVSKKHLSGDFVYDYINLVPNYLKHHKDSKFEDFYKIKNNVLNSDEVKAVLDFHAIEDFMSIGDVFVFDKDVIHRSVKLEEGEIAIRSAFALRFVDIKSTYDSYRAKQLEYPKHAFNYKGSSNFNIEVCQIDNQPIANSDIFKDNLNRRLITE